MEDKKMDYQKSYLEEKIHSYNMEMQALQMRFQMVQSELAEAQENLTEYNKKNERTTK